MHLIVDKLYGTVSLKNILILGFSFKANTNDTRESASISISRYLIDNGAKLLIHDPQVNEKQIANDLKKIPQKLIVVVKVDGHILIIFINQLKVLMQL